MPRKPLIDRPVRLEMKFPESVHTQVSLHLFSQIEGRVPKGDYSKFFTERVREFFSSRRIELTPYGFPEGFYCYGPKEMLDALEERLKNGNRAR